MHILKASIKMGKFIDEGLNHLKAPKNNRVCAEEMLAAKTVCAELVKLSQLVICFPASLLSST